MVGYPLQEWAARLLLVRLRGLGDGVATGYMYTPRCGGILMDNDGIPRASVLTSLMACAKDELTTSSAVSASQSATEAHSSVVGYLLWHCPVRLE